MPLWYYLYEVPVGIALAIAAVTLIRHRRRSRKAAGLALAATAGLIGWWIVGVWATATNLGWGTVVPPKWWATAARIFSTVTQAWLAGCLLLLVFAVVADRRRGAPTGPEADYAEPEAAEADRKPDRGGT
jgi:hypothetical protein